MDDMPEMPGYTKKIALCSQNIETCMTMKWSTLKKETEDTIEEFKNVIDVDTREHDYKRIDVYILDIYFQSNTLKHVKVRPFDLVIITDNIHNLTKSQMIARKHQWSDEHAEHFIEFSLGAEDDPRPEKHHSYTVHDYLNSL